MSDTSRSLAVNYYEAMARKDLATVSSYLDQNVQFVGPMAQATGKEPVLELTRRFFTMITGLTIHKSFGDDTQAVIVYDVECPAPIGTARAAVLVTFADKLITKFELFYDSKRYQS